MTRIAVVNADISSRMKVFLKMVESVFLWQVRISQIIITHPPKPIIKSNNLGQLPGKSRVIGTLSDLLTFYTAFDVKEGGQM